MTIDESFVASCLLETDDSESCNFHNFLLKVRSTILFLRNITILSKYTSKQVGLTTLYHDMSQNSQL